MPKNLNSYLYYATPKIDGRRARIAAVHERTVQVWLRDVDTMVMMKYALKHQPDFSR